MYYMVRSIDHAGYYETRIILIVVGLAVAGYAIARWGDYRYLVMFASGVLFQALMEWILQVSGMRGPTYSLSVFGVRLPPYAGMLYQGLAEGGIISLMSFWFADLVDPGPRSRGWLQAFVAVCVLVVALGTIVALLARGAPPSSVRNTLTPVIWIWAGVTIAVSALLVAPWGRAGFRGLALFGLGCVLYLVLTYEPMQILGARYIGVKTGDGPVQPASLPMQVLIMAWSHVYEVTGGKLHYYAIPFALGLLGPRWAGMLPFKKP